MKFSRRNGTNNLRTFNLGIINPQIKALLNVLSDSTKFYCWITYIALDPGSGKNSLFTFRSDNPTDVKFIDSELHNTGGSANELTFPRWMPDSEAPADPLRLDLKKPYWDIKFWNRQPQTAMEIMVLTYPAPTKEKYG